MKVDYFLEKKNSKGFKISPCNVSKRGEKKFPAFAMWSIFLISIVDLCSEKYTYASFFLWSALCEWAQSIPPFSADPSGVKVWEMWVKTDDWTGEFFMASLARSILTIIDLMILNSRSSDAWLLTLVLFLELFVFHFSLILIIGFSSKFSLSVIKERELWASHSPRYETIFRIYACF